MFFDAIFLNVTVQERMPGLVAKAEASTGVYMANTNSPTAMLQFKEDRLALNQAWLATQGSLREVIRVPSDGDCMFYSIAASFSPPLRWEYLRAATIGFMRYNAEWEVSGVFWLLRL